MPNISHFGTVATITASNTIPLPAPVTHFADDGDGLSFSEVQVADMSMGTNGHGITWTMANPREVTVNLIPNTLSHVTLNTIYEANYPEKGTRPARDKITIVVISPDGATITLSNGVMTSGTPAFTMSSSGRLKTQSYKFKFAKMFYTPSPDALLEI